MLTPTLQALCAVTEIGLGLHLRGETSALKGTNAHASKVSAEVSCENLQFPETICGPHKMRMPLPSSRRRICKKVSKDLPLGLVYPRISLSAQVRPDSAKRSPHRGKASLRLCRGAEGLRAFRSGTLGGHWASQGDQNHLIGQL